MAHCDLCNEKSKEITRILKAYRKDKKVALITIGVLLVELILTLAHGKDGILLGFELLKGVIK